MFWRSQWIIICAHLVAQLSPQPLPRLILTGSPRDCSSWASNPHLDSMYALTMNLHHRHYLSVSLLLLNAINHRSFQLSP